MGPGAPGKPRERQHALDRDARTRRANGPACSPANVRALVGADVVGPAGAAGGVGGGVDAGEGTELVGEVGLVVIAAVEREFGPANVGSRVELANGALEALDAAPDFGREADLLAKDLRETALAPTDLASGFGDAGDAGIVGEAAKRELNQRGARAALDVRNEAGAKELFEAVEARIG